MIIAGQKRSPVIKIISLILAFTFSFYNVSFASIKNLKAPEITSDSGALIPAKVGIAIDTGTIKSQYQGDSGRTIVHIQDAHCNFEAQNNINKILEQLASECGMDMISVEGAEGIVDTAWFRAFPDAEIRKEVATYFMKKGEITGAEYFSINSDYNGTIFGAETREYYIKNLKAFTEVYPYKNAIEKYFSDTSAIMNRLKSIVYPANLKNLDSKIQAFDSKEIELSDYAAYLEKITQKNKIEISKYPNFKKLTQTLEYEDKIDFDIVDSERSTYIDVLGKRLPKEEMAELVAQSIRFKKGHIKAVDFYSYLRELANAKKIKMVQEYPNLFYYYIYTKLYDGIDNEELFKEIDAIQRALKEKFFTTPTERTLDRYDEIVKMYVDLVNIELTNDDYDLFKKYSKEVSVEDTFYFINELTGRYNLNYSIGEVPSEIKNNLPNMISFYEIAMKRDKALIDNTLKEMDEKGKDRCVLIAGGFHTRGMKDLLEKKGISYVVVTPKITKDVETPYIKVLTNQRTSIEDMITESAVMPGMGTTSSQNNMASQTARELVSPLYRVGYANMLFNEKGISELEKLSEELGNIDGMEEATFINRVKSTFTEAVSMATDEWLLKVHGNLMQETGHDGWQKIWDNRNYQKDLLSVYLEIIWSELQKIEKAKGITGRIRGTESTYKALRNVAIKVFAEQFNAPAKPRSLGAAANTELAAQEAAFEVKRENLNSIIDIVKNGEGATEVIAITNGGDGEIVNAYLEQLSSDIFNAKEPVAVMAHEEVTRRGQFLGLLDAMKAWKEKNGDFKKDGVSLGIMMPGKGTRLSPFTHRLHGIKPFITMLIKAGEKWLSGATASMYTWNQVAYNLKRMGFRGIAWKWGDEPQIASKSLGSLNYDLSETDIVRFGSTMLVTDDLAENKEWINADEEGNLVGWARRRNRKDLLERLGVEETDDAKAFVHIGSPAFSYIFIEEAMKVFEDVPQESWIDVDGYLIEALTMDKETWDSEYHMERRVGATGIETVLKNCPDFYQRAQKLRENINRRRGKALDAQLNIKVINFGEDLYWGDVGQLDAARKAFYNVNKDDYDGEFARMLAGIEDVNPDEFGNRVIGDCVYPKDGSVKNSTLINTKIYGSADISDAVLVDSDLRNVMVGAGSVVYNSTVIDLTVGENAFSFMSVGNKIDVQERSVHTSMPKDISDISKGLDNWRAPTLDDKGNSINIGKGELYNEPQFGNPMSFNEMREIMRQREVSPQAIESEIDAKLRAPIKEKLERYQQLASKFTPLKFGTSGLRGFIAVMTDMEMYINTQGFLKSQNVQPGEVVVIGGDRRPSTPDIMTAVGKAVEDYGAIPEFIGYMPSPTVFTEGTKKGQINIMVTGSHIPFDRNGIKYGKRGGEVLKSDEAGILAQVSEIRGIEYSRLETSSIFNDDGKFKIKPEYDLVAGQAAATENYINRYVDAFPSYILAGVKVAFWQHSAVGRDIIYEIFKRLGAEVVIVERSEVFVPIDTEKLTPAMEVMLKKIAEEQNPDVIISTDGDSDRPLLADENGNFLTGDKLGALVTMLLKPDFVAFPVSTNDSVPAILEARGIKVVQTKIGSPYVVKAMLDKLGEDQTAKVVSWEANGGYLLGSDWTIAEGREPMIKLASRDAVLPLLATITLAQQEGLTVGELIDQKLRHPETGEHRMNSAGVFDKFTELFGVEGDEAFDLMKGTVKSISPELNDNKVISVDFANEKVERLEGETFDTKVLPIDHLYTNGDNVEWFRVKQLLESVFSEYGFPEITNINILDGVKIRFANGESSHLRPSSNAPEFRNYAMANNMERAKEIVEVGVTKIIPDLVRKVFEGAGEEVEAESDVLPAGIMERISQDKDYKALDAAKRAQYVLAVSLLYEKVKSGERIPFKRYFKLGSDGYKWGLPFEEYVRESYFNGIGAKELLNILVNSLSLEQLEAFQRQYRALRSKQGFDSWLKESIQNGVVAERWFTANTIEIGGVSLPMKVLTYFPQEVFGRDHSVQFGAKNSIVAKHLTSKVPLSLQLHTFAEMIVPMNEGDAWLGLKNDISAEEFLKACKEGKVDDVMNKVELKPGVPMVVPAFMPHAYGKVNVYEVKAVTAAEDMGGTISFFDRLKFIPVLEELGLSSLDMPAERLLEINPGRAKKDVLTMTPEQFEDTVKWLKEAEKRGMLNKLNVDDIVYDPVVIEKEDKARFEKMGETDKFVTARYVLDEGGIIDQAEMLEGRFHTLFVSEGEVEITTFRGNGYVLQEGQKVQVYTAMGGYEIVAEKGPAVVYTQVESLPNKTEKTIIGEGKKVEGTELPRYKENIVLDEFPMGNIVASDEVEIVEKGRIRPPAIIAGREHTLIVTEGGIRLLDKSGEVITELYSGEFYDIDPGVEYFIEKNGIEADKKAAVKFDYVKSNIEEDLYAVYDVLNKHMPALVGNKVDLILPTEMFRRGGRGDVGSKEWEERQLNEMLGGKDTVKIHTYNSAAFDSISSINIREDAVGIIGATGKNLTVDYTLNEPLQEFIADNRVLPLSDQDNLAEGGLLLARKIEGAALMQALIKKEDIDSSQSVAEDARTLMTQLTGKSVEMTALYYMLPFKDVRGVLSQIEGDPGADIIQMSFLRFKERLVEVLGLKPMQPLIQNLQKEIENRMKALWSV